MRRLGKFFRRFFPQNQQGGGKIKKLDSAKMVSSAYLAQLFNLTARRINQLAKEGIIPFVQENGVNRYDMVEATRQYIKYLTNKSDGTDESRKLEAEADLKRSKADIAALQLKELEGTMHRSEDVEAVMTDLVYSIRSMLIALPGRLAVDTFGAGSAAEASDIIRIEVYKVLEELAAYKYDPEAYARRVREREGWRELADGEED